MDFDERGKLIGVEILEATKILDKKVLVINDKKFFIEIFQVYFIY